MLGDQRLRCRAVALVRSAAGRFAVRLVADVIGQLGLHRPLDQALGQLGQDPAGPGDLLLGRGAGEQLVDELVADPPIGRHVESLPDPAAARGPIHRLIDHAGPQHRGVRGARAAPRLPSAKPSSLPLAGVVAEQPRRVPSSQSLKLELQRGPAVLLGPASRCRRHSDLLWIGCLHRGSDTPEALRSAAGCAAGRPLVHSPTAFAVVSSLSVGWGVIVIVSGWAHLTTSACVRGRARGPVSGRLSMTIDWRDDQLSWFPVALLVRRWGVKYRSGCVGLKGGPGGCSGRRVRVGWSGLFARGRPALLRSTALGLVPGPATRCLLG